MIAFFGGAAGMIGLTRKVKTNLIPGVAIATALMPPLCTAGYGIASGRAVIAVVAIATLVPSGYLALRLVQDEAFVAVTDRFVRAAVQSREDVTLLSREVDPQQRQLTLTLFAPAGFAGLQAALERQWAETGLSGAKLVIRHPSEARPDLGAPRRWLQARLPDVDVALNLLTAGR